MIKTITGLTSSGLKDWYIQRVTAVVLAVYTLFLVGFILCHNPMQFSQWQALFHNDIMRYCTVLAVLCIIGHAWVGMWTVLTDYIHCAVLRSILMLIFVAAFIAYLLWTVMILWS